jgi:hypothetical protein
MEGWAAAGGRGPGRGATTARTQAIGARRLQAEQGVMRSPSRTAMSLGLQDGAERADETARHP